MPLQIVGLFFVFNRPGCKLQGSHLFYFIMKLFNGQGSTSLHHTVMQCLLACLFYLLDVLSISNLYFWIIFLWEESYKFSNFIKFILTFYQGMVSIIESSKEIFFFLQDRQESQDPLYACIKVLFISYENWGSIYNFQRPHQFYCPSTLGLPETSCSAVPSLEFVPLRHFFSHWDPQGIPVSFDLAL